MQKFLKHATPFMSSHKVLKLTQIAPASLFLAWLIFSHFISIVI